MLDAALKRNKASDAPDVKQANRDVSGEVDIGAKLRLLRNKRGLTLQDVSLLSGVSASAFSKIERNEISPTISTMQRIAHGLDIELVTLLTEEQSNNTAGVGGRRSVSRAGAGNVLATGTCKNVLLCSDLKNKRATPILTTVKARSTDEYTTGATSDAEVFLMVLQGSLIVHNRVYEPLELNQGDCVYYDASIEHTWTSAGPTDAVVLWVLIG